MRSRGILAGLLASAALVGAFACPLVVIGGDRGEPAPWPDALTGAQDRDLRLVAPAPVPVPATPVAPAVVASPATRAAGRRAAAAPPRPQAVETPAPPPARRVLPKLPVALPDVPAVPEVTTPPSLPDSPAPTVTQAAGDAVAATARSTGAAVAPVSPQGGQAVEDTGQAVGDAVARIGPG